MSSRSCTFSGIEASRRSPPFAMPWPSRAWTAAYTTVATLVRILTEKSFLVQTNQERPFFYRAARSYEDVSRKLLGDLLDRVFRGSREQLLVRLMEQNALTAKERSLLGEVLRQEEKRR